jgi:LytR cell envelope-related transcriptional attenuator
MSPKTEPDRFDELPTEIDRGGSHRSLRARRGGVTFAWAALATGVLVGLGTMGLFAYNGKLDIGKWIFPTHVTASPVVVVPATIDAKMAIAVLNGTATDGLASSVGDVLTKAGLTVSSRANSSETTVKKTMVFYAVRSYEGAARGACKALGSTCTVKFTTAYATSGSPLTMVVGANYKAPVAP